MCKPFVKGAGGGFIVQQSFFALGLSYFTRSPSSRGLPREAGSEKGMSLAQSQK